MKESSCRESIKDKIKEPDEEIVYEKLLFIGDKNVGKLSLIQNLFSQDSNIIISENINKNNIDIENNTNNNNESNENNNNNNSNKEEKKDVEKKEEIEKNNNTDNNIKTEGKEEIKDNNNNTEKKDNQVIIYEKKQQMKNNINETKYFQIFITSFCDNNLIHSLGFMCQCILVLFDVKNKISFENAKKS